MRAGWVWHHAWASCRCGCVGTVLWYPVGGGGGGGVRVVMEVWLRVVVGVGLGV